MNIQLKQIRKELAPFEQLIKERNYLTLGHQLSGAKVIDQVRDEYNSLCFADAFKLSASHRRHKKVVLAGHSLLSAIEIALSNKR